MGLAPAAAAETCRPQPIRWQDDCDGLATKTRTGVDQLRYVPLAGDAWLTLGGEARVRMESVGASEFGIEDAPSYLEISRRALFQADLRTPGGLRVFGQLGAVAEEGRKPGPRAQDEDQLDLPQLFVELPARVGDVALVARVGRQEIDLSDNRLVTTRDGANVRRSFDGAQLESSWAGARLILFRFRPVEVRRYAFDDGASATELFAGASLDLPRRGPGLTTLFLFDRERADAKFVGLSGHERRRTAGARYARRADGWDVYAQAAYQWGQMEGQPISAAGGAAGASFTFDAPHSPRLGGVAAFASGDRRAGDGRLGTFDPVYPNSYGLSDAPFLYQTNYIAVAGEGAARFGPAELGGAAYLVGRYATGDAIYGQGRPLTDSTGHGRLTAVLLQANARVALAPNLEFYGSVVRAVTGDGVTAAGGKDSTYVRMQLTARF
ncbi:MAG: alginate export family protein [Phenylobacterium sp.]|nr:alginate export family protein [Phenylobacterium sp.]